MEVEKMSKVMLIINPSSGKGAGKEIQSDLEKALSASFDDVETRFTEGEGDAKDWAREASDVAAKLLSSLVVMGLLTKGFQESLKQIQPLNLASFHLGQPMI